MAPEKEVVKTVKEAKMARKMLYRMDAKRKLYGESAWLYPTEAFKGFNPSAVRSFLEKLEREGVIEYLGRVEGIEEWGGVFRFTKNGEERIRRELAEITGF
jgi:2,4-dienoyl-CoA reductase-like NADH-dependent reductase (Old Yellow Enzyme family)